VTDWVVAGDIGKRLAELRACLGESQTTFAKRFGRTWKRVSAWENGASTPPQSVLVQAAERAGWDTAMFAEGGIYPRQALECVRMPQESSKAGGGTSGPTRSPGRRAEDYARSMRADAARLSVLLDRIRMYRDQGRSPSPEILEEWLAIMRANSLGGGPPSSD